MKGTIGVGTGVASLLALRQNRWSGAQAILGLRVAYAICAEYVALTKIASSRSRSRCGITSYGALSISGSHS